MKPVNKTKAQLYKELESLRSEVNRLRALESDRKRMDEALKEYGMMYKLMVLTPLEAMIVTDLYGKLVEVSPETIELLGYNSSEELLGKNVMELFRLNDENASKNLLGILQDIAERNIEYRLIRKDGTSTWGEVNTNVIHDSCGKEKAIIILITEQKWNSEALKQACLELANTIDKRTADLVSANKKLKQQIEKRKGAEDALRESEERFRGIVELSPFPISIFDFAGRYLFVNRRFTEVFGYMLDDIPTGKRWFELAFPNPEYRQSALAQWKADFTKLEKGEEKSRLFKVTCKNGTVRDIIFRPLIMNNKNQFITYEDITERRQAEDALRKSEEKYRDLVENINDVLYSVDKEGIITYISPIVKLLLGYNPSELIGKKFGDFFYKEDQPNITKDFKKTLSGFNVSSEYRFLNRAGEVRWVRCSNRPVLMKNSIMAVQGVMTDITNQKKMQDELIKSQKIESIGVLAGGIAHDFNNILMGIMGNISLAKYMGPENEINEILGNAEKATMRAKNLTQQLLTFSKGGAPIKNRVSIIELIKDTAKFALTGSNVKCDYFIPEDLWMVEIDEGQMSQVINNLIINAEQAMPDGGVVKIYAENISITQSYNLPVPEGNYVLVSVEDNGHGIPNENLQKIFDPFFTTKKKGNGLGLAISYSIIKNHKGYITVQSKAGTGAIFYIYLPASKKKIETKKEIEKNIIPGIGKILIMDDEEMVRNSAGVMLKQIGYQVDFAKDGEEAIKKYQDAKERRHPYDIMIMDLTIQGGMGGKEAIKKLHKMDPRVKAIVSSGYSNDPIMAEFREYGFCGVILKPYDIKELSVTLHHVINVKAGTA